MSASFMSMTRKGEKIFADPPLIARCREKKD